MGYVYKRKTKDKETGEIREWSIWWIKYYRDGKAIRESSGSEKESYAKNLLKLREGDVARGIPVTPKMGRVKFDELARDVTTNYQINKKRSLGHVQRRLQKHLLPFFGGRRASSITSSDVEKFILRRQAAGASNAEINRELAVLKRAFTLGCRAGKLMSKPHVQSLSENNVRRGFFERPQFESVRRHLPEDLRPMVTFAYLTGWRVPSEVLRLQWRQVDFAGCKVILDPGTTKNNEGRVFPLTDELRTILERQRARTDALQRELGIVCPWVFLGRVSPSDQFVAPGKAPARRPGWRAESLMISAGPRSAIWCGPAFPNV